MIKRFLNLVIANAILFFAISADAQFGFGKPKSGLQPMRSAVDLIKKQAPLRRSSEKWGFVPMFTCLAEACSKSGKRQREQSRLSPSLFVFRSAFTAERRPV